MDQNNYLPNEAHQIVLGSLLGDMHCRKEYLNSNLEEGHSITQKDYLKWKYSILKGYFNLYLYNCDGSIGKIKGKPFFRKPQIRLRSKVSKKINIYRELFYKSNKKILNKDVLNQLDAFGLAVWYCDDGYYDPENHMAEIHTEGFLIKENQLLKKWFSKRWDINVNFKKDPSKKRILIRFPVKETDKFLNLIKESIFSMPECMWYKLGHIWEGNIEILKKANLNKIRRMKVYEGREEIKIRKRQRGREYYYKNKEKFFLKAEEYRKTQKYKEYIREYTKRPEVIKRRKEWLRSYRQRPGYKMKRAIYQGDYYKRPEVKAKIREYNERAKEKWRRRLRLDV